MRLERLEIHGFKSFSDRSELAFDEGVTAIVGPNGCGKSNVADAITWVMGEQSAKSLRGERMEDVIFSGSDARKPTATAEVRLRFTGVVKSVTGPAFPENGNGHDSHLEHSDNGHGPASNGNSNGHSRGNGNGTGHVLEPTPAAFGLDAEALIQSVARDVEVTRRLYRSGDSEYLIDGQACRLRDVHDLLMDTGLGAKAYAIIEQGKIGLILSSRPTDRRQLIEEAAGVTKYKSRRRSAELKLEAAQQNLTRIEDIVFEIEKQRGILKRQAAKARRYQKLRDELRRWEKVLFARRYRQLAEAIESARARLTEARERESAASARVAEIEAQVGGLRLELVDAESHATAAREETHARELAINRQEQRVAFEREQIRTLEARATTVAAELQVLEARREPARAALAVRREAAAVAAVDRVRAEQVLADDTEAYDAAHREIEGLEADVEAARSEVFSAINSATALRHALEHAASARDKVAETLTKLDVEIEDVRIESERVAADHTGATENVRHGQQAIEATRMARAARESELASARIEHEWRARSVRAREHEMAGLDARLKSLEQLQVARAGYGDAARAVLAQANGKVNQRGAVADYVEVDANYERAVEACLGDLLEHVIVEEPGQATAGFQLVREEGVGRCGFVITTEALAGSAGAGSTFETVPPGLVPLSSIMRVNGPYGDAIRLAIGEAWVADSYEHAAQASRLVAMPVATLTGEVFHGPHVVSGGGVEEGRGILETKREIHELRDRLQHEREALGRLVDETSEFEAAIVQASNAIAALNAEHHRQEKAVVGYEAQLQRALDDTARLTQKGEQLVRERRQATEERETLDRRQEEARASIVRLELEQRAADERFTTAQRRLFEAREAAEDLNRRAAHARAAHAALVERATGLEIEVERLEEAATELETRASALAGELDDVTRRVAQLAAAVADGQTQLDADVVLLVRLRGNVAAADEIVSTLRAEVDGDEVLLKDARVGHETIRGGVAELDIARATAQSDLSHLSQSCLDAVQLSLDEVVLEVAEMENNGQASSDGQVLCVEETADPADEDADAADAGAAPAATTTMVVSADEAIARLRAKIERLGPVNMMAIEQFDELDTRHAFLTNQRNDLVGSIAQTSEAIKRIDQTTRQRFAQAFAAINYNFQETFATLFGGGRAGLTLLDENDPLESGIEIIAQPPGKRLQSVQLLSGGEKALTAIALMFGLFKYKPSPFCLLDEIDAPLDDANIGRFVEMLRGMQQHTQFILITHNRKTMEIADRLYGVTMEEPGVSKLISVQLN